MRVSLGKLRQTLLITLKQKLFGKKSHYLCHQNYVQMTPYGVKELGQRWFG